MKITVRYKSVDGFGKVRHFKTLRGAHKFAVCYVGDNPELGINYAISQDGVGRITVEGCTLESLFSASPEKEKEAVETDEQRYQREADEWEARSEWICFGRYGR
jgi:hypothetical protein